MAEETKTTVETTTNATENQSNVTEDDSALRLASETARANKNKLELDKALKELGEVKKALKAKQTAEEAEAEEKAKSDKMKDDRIAELEKQINYSNAVGAYKDISEKVVEQLITAVSEADHLTIATIIANEKKLAVSAAEKTWMGSRPAIGSNSYSSMTVEQIMAITDRDERQRAIAMNLDLFNK
jgi:hypothetical protein